MQNSRPALPSETPENVRRALGIYLELATPPEYSEPSWMSVADQLQAEGFEGSARSVGRWKEKYSFRAHLDFIVAAAMADEESRSGALTTSANEKAINDAIVDVTRNEKLTTKTYNLMENFLDEQERKIEAGKPIGQKDLKLIIQISQLTTGRTDKMLDRLAQNPDKDKITAEETRELLKSTVIDVEIDEE